MIGKVFDRIEAFATEATKSELKIIEETKKLNLDLLTALTIRDLSLSAGVGEATVSRFCRRLGYSNFQEFKLTLCRELCETGNDVKSDCPKTKRNRMCDAIDETYAHTDYEKHLEIAREIVQARRVCVFGYSNSAISSIALRFRLLREGIITDGTSDPHMRHMSVANLDERDIVILISISGNTQDVVSLAECAKKGGAKIVAITDNSRSTLASFADYILLSSRKEGAHYAGSLATVVAQIYVADVLCAAVCEVLGKESK